jgi:hypothetical protein
MECKGIKMSRIKLAAFQFGSNLIQKYIYIGKSILINYWPF